MRACSVFRIMFLMGLHMQQTVPLIIVLTLVSACGGTSTGQSFAPETPSHATVYAEGYRIAEIARALDPTPLSAPELQGNATYDGVLGIELQGVSATIDRIDGDVRLAVDFEDEAVTGDAGDFYSQIYGKVDGALAISDGLVLDEGTQLIMLAEFEGDLELSRVSRAVSGILIGEFGGADARTLTGGLSGSYRIDPTPGSSLDTLNVDRITFEGGFVTERSGR